MRYTKCMPMLRVLEHLIIDTLSSFVYWPVWWYTTGFVAVLKWYMATVQYYARMSAVGVWVKNIFTPMFGQYDWQSRLISFIVRVGNIVVRSFGLVLWALVCALAVIAYLLWLPFLVFVISYYVI